MISEQERTMARLRDRISDLEDQIRDLKGERIPLPDKITDALSPRELMLFRLLVARHNFVPHTALYAAVYGARASDADEREVVNIIRHIRRKLTCLGITVQTKHGFGYKLTEEGRAALEALS